MRISVKQCRQAERQIDEKGPGRRRVTGAGWCVAMAWTHSHHQPWRCHRLFNGCLAQCHLLSVSLGKASDAREASDHKGQSRV
jgi:hypothetical protein